MVNTFGNIEDFHPIEQLGNDLYRIAWGREDDQPAEGEPAKTCVYTLEIYSYKPTMLIVTTDIIYSGRHASMEEIRDISEALGEDPLPAMKRLLKAYIDGHDSSEAVNSFLLDGSPAWIDKATRVGLMNSTTIALQAGRETTAVWFGGKRIELPCQAAIQMLSALEMYALECFNVTAQHQAAVDSLATVEEALAYDYKAGYPNKLSFSTTPPLAEEPSKDGQSLEPSTSSLIPNT